MNGITKIWLCSGIPVDNKLQNFRIFQNETQYFEWVKSFAVVSFSEYTFQRESQELYIEKYSEDIKNANYMVYTNGVKNYYAFINSCEYENENCSKIKFTVDHFSNWFYNLDFKPCFIERETVSDDTVGKHTIIESFPMEYTSTNEDNNIVTGLGVYMLVSDPLDMGDFWNPPAIVGGFPIATYYKFLGSLSDYTTSVIENILNKYNEKGKIDSVVSIFTVPLNFFSNGSNINQKQWLLQPLRTAAPVKNNKLKCYPYTSLQVQIGGSLNVLKYEDFTGQPEYRINAGFGADLAVSFTPLNYAGIPYNTEYTQVLTGFPLVPWIKDYYQNYIAQNKANNMITSVVNIGKGAAMGAAAGVNSGVPQLAVAGAAGGVFSALANTFVNQLQNNISASFVPDSLQGSARATDIELVAGQFGARARCKTLKLEYLKAIDDYFSMYGYLVNIVKLPELYSRTSWNYIKTNGFLARGNIPADSAKVINTIFDNGVTLWHNDDIGNYSLNNNIRG